MTKMISALREGHARYKESRLPEYKDLYKKLADSGQEPKALMITCSDSRIDPALLFDQNPGDLFVIRNVANVVPPYDPRAGYHGTSAALEYAVKDLNISDIIVMGHANCGGVEALIEMVDGKPPSGEFIGSWMAIAQPAAISVKDKHSDNVDRNMRTEHEVVRLSLDNLLTFPWVAEKNSNNQLALHGFYFDIRDGSMLWLNSHSNQFENFT